MAVAVSGESFDYVKIDKARHKAQPCVVRKLTFRRNGVVRICQVKINENLTLKDLHDAVSYRLKVPRSRLKFTVTSNKTVIEQRHDKITLKKDSECSRNPLDKEIVVEELKPSIPESELPSRLLGKNEGLSELFLEALDIDEGTGHTTIDYARRVWSVWKKFAGSGVLVERLTSAKFEARECAEEAWCEHLRMDRSVGALANLSFAVGRTLLNSKTYPNFPKMFIEKKGVNFLIKNYCRVGSKYRLNFIYLKLLKYIQEAIIGFYVP